MTVKINNNCPLLIFCPLLISYIIFFIYTYEEIVLLCILQSSINKNHKLLHNLQIQFSSLAIIQKIICYFGDKIVILFHRVNLYPPWNQTRTKFKIKC